MEAIYENMYLGKLKQLWANGLSVQTVAMLSTLYEEYQRVVIYRSVNVDVSERELLERASRKIENAMDQNLVDDQMVKEMYFLMGGAKTESLEALVKIMAMYGLKMELEYANAIKYAFLEEYHNVMNNDVIDYYREAQKQRNTRK